MSPVNHAAPPPRRPWYRYLYQFSLRTLLVATTLAAVACWWWLRPEQQEEQLAGQHLKLRQQVKYVSSNVPNMGDQIVSVGSWELVNEHGDRLVLGRYADDVPTGHWRLYYPHGQRAAEGKLSHGVRDGLWRMWDEAGTLRSEVTFRAVPGFTRYERAKPPPTLVGFGKSLMDYPSFVYRDLSRGPFSQRLGPVRTSHASGRLACEGTYASDRRTGTWTWYDEAGNVARRAEFRDGVEVADRTELLASLAQELRSGDVRTQLAAAERLEQLASQAVPTLVDSLTATDRTTQLLALRALDRLNAITIDHALQLETLSSSTVAAECPPLALRATLLLYALHPEKHDEHFAQFEKLEPHISPRDRLEALLRIAELDESRRAAVMAKVMHLLAHEPVGPIGVIWGTEREVSSYDDAMQVAAVRFDLTPILSTALDSPDVMVRRFAVLVIEYLVEHEHPDLRVEEGGTGELLWEIPANLKPLVNRALKDPDSSVVAQAEGIGREYSGNRRGQPTQGGGFF